MVEDIHMKARMIGTIFAIRIRVGKACYFDANLKNTLNQLLSDASAYGTDNVVSS
jgi:hypothetical protein